MASKLTKNNNINIVYPLEVWFTTIVIVAPLIIIFYDIFFSRPQSILFGDYSVVAIIPIGIILSTPVLLLYYSLFRFLIKKEVRALHLKFILLATVITGIILTFYCIGGTAEFTMTLLYSTSVLLSSFIFRISKKEEEISQTGG
jgi:hypothetical protein